MTKHDVLGKVREAAPGEYTDERVVQSIEELEQRILRELLDGYIIPESGGELTAPPPYDMMYQWWALANIALTQQDLNAYNNYIAMFNALWDEYARMISRTYRRDKWVCYSV